MEMLIGFAVTFWVWGMCIKSGWEAWKYEGKLMALPLSIIGGIFVASVAGAITIYIAESIIK